ncbi:hypothetical protein [Paraburkholderia tropica]|uniref:hypothetical protein n=1 Tax=Paraburkholderia tropica TaxID=92647 RepID=UPI001CC4D8B8|nr:hypothetical protein [Paraburkholderia tropica]
MKRLESWGFARVGNARAALCVAPRSGIGLPQDGDRHGADSRAAHFQGGAFHAMTGLLRFRLAYPRFTCSLLIGMAVACSTASIHIPPNHRRKPA